MKNKGFTLSELLGVIVIISIILLLIMIPITKNIQRGSETIHESQIKLIELGVENWMSDNASSLPQKDGEKITITVGTLKQEGLLDMDIKDPVTGECIPNNTEVTITNQSGKYDINIDLDSGTDECPEIEGKSPIIYLNGEALMYVKYGSTWTDPGVTAKTYNGVPITSIDKVITGSGSSVNTNGFNTYEITYSVTDNGITVSVRRTVIIADTTAPTITVPENTVIPSTQTTFNALDGVTAIDDADGNITSKIKVTGTVTPGVLGEYTLTYEVTDDSGNTSKVTRKVRVEDKSKPTASATVVGSPLNSDGWAKANFQVKIKTNDTGGSGVAGLKYCQTTSTTCTPNTNVSKTVETLTISSQSSTNYICVIPYDHAGNEGTRQCFGPYKLDKTVPTTGVSAAASQFNSSGWAKANITVNITTNDTGSSNVKTYTYCTSTTATCTPSTTETGTSKNITISSNGTKHYVCAYSTDYAGNKSSTACTGPLKLDKSAPSVTLTVNNNQFNGNGWAKANISASLTSSDSGDSSVKSYTYCVGTASCTPGTTVNATSGTLTMSSESSTNYVCAYTTDNAGNNSATSCKGPYKLDKTAPSINFPVSTNINQSAGSYDLKTGVTVSDNLTAAGSISLSASGNLNFSTPGNYTINYTATDLAGNQKTASRTVTIVDTTPPSLSVSSACTSNGENGWCRGNVNVTLSPSDNATGISERQYKINNGSWNGLSGNSHTLSDEGSYTVYYRVKDGAGNWSTESSVSVKIDKSNPSGINVSINGSSISISGSDTSGYNQYKIDSGSYQTSASFSGISYGTHTLYVKDAAGNVGSTTFTIQPQLSVNSSAVQNGAWHANGNWKTSGGTFKINSASSTVNGSTVTFYANITVATTSGWYLRNGVSGGNDYERWACLSSDQSNNTGPSYCASSGQKLKNQRDDHWNGSQYTNWSKSYDVTLTITNPSGCYSVKIYTPAGNKGHWTTSLPNALCITNA